MIFVFNFYLTDRKNSGILGDILRFQSNLLRLSYVEVFEEQQEDLIAYRFYILATQEEALRFADQISLSIPISIYFKFDGIEKTEIEDLNDIENAQYYPAPADMPLDAKLMGDLFCLQDFSLVEKNLKNLYIYTPIAHLRGLEEALKRCIQDLKGEGLVVDTARGRVLLSCEKKTHQILFWDLNNIKTYMRLDPLQAQFLASYEKPSMDLCPKEVFEEEFGGRLFECFLPYDLFLGILGITCLQNGIDYVFVSELSQAKDSFQPQIFYQQDAGVVPREKIVVAQSGVILHTQRFQGSVFDLISAHQKNLSFVDHSRKIQSDRDLIVCFSKNNPTLFWLGKDKEYQSVLNLNLDCNPRNAIEKIKAYTDGEKLVKNFYTNFPDIEEKIGALQDSPQLTQNIFDFFNTLSFIAGYEEDFSMDSLKILENARKYVRDKGPRIDYKILKDESGKLFLDYPKILRSMMSFLLAGVDKETLSYGVIDSMAECFGNFMQDLCVNFSIQNVLIFGNLLEEKIFLDKILHYAPKQINLVLPKNGFLDYQQG